MAVLQGDEEMHTLTYEEEDMLYLAALKKLKYNDSTVSAKDRHRLYRNLCKEFHPDLNPEMLEKDPNSETIKQINIAYTDIKNGTVRHIVPKKRFKRKTEPSQAKTGQYYNANWQQNYRDPIDMNVLYQELDKTCKKVEKLRAAKRQATKYIDQVEREVRSIERQFALAETRKQTNQHQLQRLSIPFLYRWCMDVYQTVLPQKGSYQDKALQLGLGIFAGVETFVLGVAYIAIVPYPVFVFLAMLGTKKALDIMIRKTGISTKNEQRKQEYRLARNNAAKNQFGLTQEKNKKLATKQELSEYRSKLDQKLKKATDREGKILSAIRKASSYNAKAYQKAYEENTGYTYQAGYEYKKGRV